MKQLLFLFLLVSSIAFNQCNQYQIYESFTSTLPTQGGTWTSNSMIVLTTPVRTGTHSIGFNGTGDWIRTPQIATPGVLTFWYRRSTNTTAWTLNIQTSPDGTTWTTRGSITAVTATYQQYTLNIGALGLTNVFIRLLDARAAGAQERYVDDLAITSTTASTNTLLPILGACSRTLTSSLTYTLSDDGGPAGPISTGYGNSVDRTITLTPSDNTKKLKLAFTQLDLETTYDYLYVYDGANTSATLLATLNGSTLPSDISATNASGQLTIRWTTDISNVGTWGGFLATITSITLPTPSCIASPTSPTDAATNQSLTATITWPAATYATSYDVYFGATLPVTATTNTTSTTYNPGTLLAGTTYYWKIVPKNSVGEPTGCTTWSFTTLTPPINDNPIGAIQLTIGTVVNYSTYTNLYATNTTTESTPSCASYAGEDVWFKVTVPQYINSLDFDTQTGDITDGGMAIYRGTPGSLVEIQCDDDSSPNGLMSFISRADFFEYETIYIRVWEYAGGTTGTFGISVTTPQPLPVELLYFEGVKYPTFNSLKWATASESNSSHFVIEKSTDGLIWLATATKPAAGNSIEKLNYFYIDNINYFGLTYYKLIQYDIDGRCESYGPIAINNTRSKTVIRRYNLIGQIVDETATGIIIEVFDDGTMQKIIR
ncbi:CUB domain [uncultured Caudovirales phage]|uniref:CUB domain n=1 Tax=uncultured Caudovirales phage TaxID=2100421 RepID=A0A6J5NMN5_9CAUD|nr:CUB domain [uncultured Caudovirales phage]